MSPGGFLVPRSKIPDIRASLACEEEPLILSRLQRFARRVSKLMSHAAYLAKSTGIVPREKTLCSKSDLFFTIVLISS